LSRKSNLRVEAASSLLVGALNYSSASRAAADSCACPLAATLDAKAAILLARGKQRLGRLRAPEARTFAEFVDAQVVAGRGHVYATCVPVSVTPPDVKK
jgi:hypothetical protein